MSQQSQAFGLLHPGIQRFIWTQGWESLRDAQEAAIAPILAADRDVIVAAATAAGKTEAAFLPALTHLLNADKPTLIVYISPLKALINDQFGRLELMCQDLEVPVWPWHGDVGANLKAKFRSKPHGVLLITPESMEAMFCNQGPLLAATLGATSYVIVDELHAFIGSERGKQLQALMHRLDVLLKRRVPRVGLSATLGDMKLAAQFLRPGDADRVHMVVAGAGAAALKILIKGYVEPTPAQQSGGNRIEDHDEDLGEQAAPQGSESFDHESPHPASPDHQAPDAEAAPVDAPEPQAPGMVAAHLFDALRGTNNLVFPNSRAQVERYTALLNRRCEQEKVPNEFWPHHGSLSKEIRSQTEAALKNKAQCATAICTNTLELGIDIGAVVSVAQVGPPPSVASLRQRLGRSGRRKGEAAILRGYAVEKQISPDLRIEERLRLDLLMQIAMVELLLENWFEPPRAGGLHLSTLVQQILSAIAQHGGASIAQLYGLLCNPGAPFAEVSKQHFMDLVRELGQREILMQDKTGLLLPGRVGEAAVNNFRFYAAFRSDDEYRLVARGKTLGTLPVTVMFSLGDRLMFAGRTWRIESVDPDALVIFLAPARGGAPPMILGQGARHHTRVIERVRHVLAGQQVPAYLDAVARQLLQEARDAYRELALGEQLLLPQGEMVRCFTWMGDDANEALVAMLRALGLQAQLADLGVCFTPQPVDPLRMQLLTDEDLDALPSARARQYDTLEGRIDMIIQALAAMAKAPAQAPEVLLAECENLQREKWDWTLPKHLLARSYASLNLDLEQARAWVCQVLSLCAELPTA